jgi:hypothetical protein
MCRLTDHRSVQEYLIGVIPSPLGVDRCRHRRATVGDVSDERPPKPYESYLSENLEAAMKETSPSIRSVTVRGRTCTVEHEGGASDRYLVADDTLRRALAVAVGADHVVGDVTLLPWNEAEAAEPFHDGLTWVDGRSPHWCLDPSECPDAPSPTSTK